LPRITHRRPFSVLTAVLIGSAVVGAATLPALAAGPFGGLSGAWGGNGTIQPGNGTTERIRCNADYKPRGSSGSEVDINLRCASDSYNFDLTSQVRARDGSLSGSWSESSKGVSGTLSGRAGPGTIQAHVHGPFAAALTVSTSGNRQTIAIRSDGTDLTGANISLNRGSR